jgi:xylan 1,4-beta-xylosidase
MDTMLTEEKFTYAKDAVLIEIARVRDYPLCRHDNIEIVFLLRGKILIEASMFPIELGENSYFVVNTGALHRIQGLTGDDVAFFIHINQDIFLGELPRINRAMFICRSEKPPDGFPKHGRLRQQITRLVELYFGSDAAGKPERERLLYDACASILLTLTNDFQEWHYNEDFEIVPSSTFKDKALQRERLRRIVEYIYENSAHSITLDDVAEYCHVNKYYVSHLISEGLGVGFKTFLSRVRAENATTYLLATKFPVDEIAEMCGFASANMLRRIIWERTGLGPSDMRRKYSAMTIDAKIPEAEYITSEKEIRAFAEEFLKKQPAYTIAESFTNPEHSSGLRIPAQIADKSTILMLSIDSASIEFDEEKKRFVLKLNGQF